MYYFKNSISQEMFFLNIGGYQNYLLNNMRLDSNIEHKSSNNDYLNIIKFIFILLFFQFEDHRIGKFSNNIDFRK